MAVMPVRPTPQLTADQVSQLLRYDTPTVCNAIELFAVRPQTEGYMDARIEACFPEMEPTCGYASTATFRSALEPWGAVAYGSLTQQVERLEDCCSPPIVVIQDLDSPVQAATFGEVMASTYKSFGVSGLITSGAGRDLDQVRDVGLPCFADGVICSHGFPRFLDFEVPVHVGGLAVYPGDFLHADQNGVTNIPPEILGEVADVCEEFVAAEAVVLDYCKAGPVTRKGHAEAIKELGARLSDLRKRLRPGADSRQT